jgi:hypothetical protein
MQGRKVGSLVNRLEEETRKVMRANWLARSARLLIGGSTGAKGVQGLTPRYLGCLRSAPTSYVLVRKRARESTMATPRTSSNYLQASGRGS